jgi:site-specific recombinase XerD
MTTLAIADTTHLPVIPDDLEDLFTLGRLIQARAKSPNTIRSYRSDWRVFQAWGRDRGYPIPDPDNLTDPIPVPLVYAFVAASTQERVPVTVSRHISAIRFWHHQARLSSPTDHPDIRDLLAGHTNSTDYERRQARPVFYDDLRAMVGKLGDSMADKRSKALLTVGWWGAFRRSELSNLRVADVADDPSGILITLRRSKTDQAGVGRSVALHYHAEDVCPVLHLRDWLRAADRTDGFVFCGVSRWGHPSGKRLNAQIISETVKAAVASIGMNPDGYSAHSLRAGFVSECDRRRIATSAVRLVTGHTSDQMLNSYQRPGELFDSSAGHFFDDLVGV